MDIDQHSTTAGLSPSALRALRLASGHLNASSGDRIEPHELLEALTGKSADGIHDKRLHAFFDEVETETLTDLVLSGVIAYQQLAKGAAAHLHSNHETRRWLNDRATF